MQVKRSEAAAGRRRGALARAGRPAQDGFDGLADGGDIDARVLAGAVRAGVGDGDDGLGEGADDAGAKLLFAGDRDDGLDGVGL